MWLVCGHCSGGHLHGIRRTLVYVCNSQVYHTYGGIVVVVVVLTLTRYIRSRVRGYTDIRTLGRERDEEALTEAAQQFDTSRQGREEQAEIFSR